MSRWKAPDLPDGPLRELNRALHALHGRAGWPSSRELQKAVGGRDVVSYTTIHQALTKPGLPRWGVIELLVEELAKTAGGRRLPTDTVEHFKELYDRAYDDGEDDASGPQATSDAPAPSSETTGAPPPVDRVDEVTDPADAVATRAGRVTNWTGSAPQVDGSGDNGRLVSAQAELRRRITDGSYPLGFTLPPQRALATELGVSRLTVRRALQALQDEGWVMSRQGSGSRVIKNGRVERATSPGRSGRTVSLGPYIGRAFEQDDVSLDVFTLTSESLTAHIQLQAERIHALQISPRSITVRVMVPDMSLAFPYWRSREAAREDALKERAADIAHRHLTTLHNTLSNVYTSMLVPTVRFSVRQVPLVPSFKLYLINEVMALHGFYEVVERPIDLNGETVAALDALGLGAALTRHVKDDDPHSQGSVFVENARSWFESVWERLAAQDVDG
ncbi:regulatory protein, gntR family [Streptomyces sp. 1222.5]|uniref:GntR family transcriptional regulator n=1 Tax=unclassified Streptomyces TaxID=2593676 RepID=UPI000897FDB5|nr:MULTISPECIES: GntR family transcriptional regulator [unclassified Streptomyces]PKW05137.1 regulatory GntR family protein [Streptomyces sp. 5112.2]SED49496.1 regulatory protein, gntR family [Streptomyces sp. 1222.5]